MINKDARGAMMVSTDHPIRDLCVRLARLHLSFHLGLYNQTIVHSVFPRDRMLREVPGPDPERILFVGDIVVGGHGVLSEGMAFPAQTARVLARRSRRGCAWTQIASHDLTIQNAIRFVDQRAAYIDVAVIALGIPDVLMLTSRLDWTTRMHQLIEAIRDRAGNQCRIVLVGVPPVHQFQPIPLLAGKATKAQVRLLNAATSAAASGENNIVFVPSPDWSTERMYIRGIFSYRTLHRIWGETIAPHLDE